jgi:ATP-dependent RNA helicase DeaD
MPFPSLPPDLAQALAEKGYAEPTPVQAAVLQPDAAGRDLLVSAQTGSGKTLAYGLAMAPDVLGMVGAVPTDGVPLGLIVAPTRELALQVHRELGWLYAHAGLSVVSCVGGMEIRREQRLLAQGAHLVVGTPGRLRDHLERGHLDASGLRVVVLDEADEMLDLGFREDLELILDATPAERRTLLFSATLPREITALAKRYQRDAVRIATTGDQPHGDIEYRAVRVAPNETEHAVVNVLRFFEARGALVFCSTREAVRHLHGSLLERGFAAVALSGELGQNERNRALQSLRDGRARVCVATDVAARGIDLPDLGLVVHADLPQNRETLLHRSGRTGRAGRKGTSVLLVAYPQRRRAERLLAAAGVRAGWSPPPTPDEIRARDEERLRHELQTVGEPAEEDLAAARALLAERPAEAIAAALVRLHRARLPAPEELFDGGAEPERPARGAARAPAGGEDMVWFTMSVGRNGNADPRWLLPFICRRGHVTKREVGAIRILERETRFEIARHAARRFAAAVRHADGQDEGIHIEPMAADRAAPDDRRHRRPDRDAGPEPAAERRPGPGPRPYRGGAGGKGQGRAAAGAGPRRRRDKAAAPPPRGR